MSYFNVPVTCIVLLLCNIEELTNAFNCKIPKACQLRSINFLLDINANRKFYSKIKGIGCDIDDRFRFDFDDELLRFNKTGSCTRINKRSEDQIELKWPKNSVRVFDGNFNVPKLMEYMEIFQHYIGVHIENAIGFEVDMLNGQNLSRSIISNRKIRFVSISNARMIFYQNNSQVENCQDLTATTSIRSIFQFRLEILKPTRPIVYELKLNNCQYKKKLCPLLFRNSRFDVVYVNNIIDTFYTTNILKFSNENFTNLNSSIVQIFFYNVVNINLNEEIINPSVFSQLRYLGFYGSVNSISPTLFDHLVYLKEIEFDVYYFRRLIHKSGTNWIQAINRNIRVRFDNLDYIQNYAGLIKYISFSGTSHVIFLKDVFPDEDFCLYRDFPVNQLVFLLHEPRLEIETHSKPCTYVWINRHSHILLNISKISSFKIVYVNSILKSDEYRNRNKCRFEQRLKLCNRSKLATTTIIWDTYKYFIFNKKLQITIRVLTYVVSSIGISTNLIIAIVLFSDHNKEHFKGLNHYRYLAFNSIFAIIILTIELLSWLVECFYPFQVFCLDMHKTLVAQVFKIVFKECLVALLRFTINFFYITFAMSRIKLIGKDHTKLVEFMSKVDFKKYTFGVIVFGLFFSWIKFFKYQINFGHDDESYPVPNDYDILNRINSGSVIQYVYYIYNCISDLINYVVFVIVCFALDMFMVIRLRSVLAENKLRIRELFMTKEQYENKCSEFESSLHQGVQMVVINTAVAVLFKMPSAFLPLVNTYAQFYYKKSMTHEDHSKFDQFFLPLVNSGFYWIVDDMARFLFCVYLTTQFFLLNRFDKNFKNATLFKKNVSV